MGSRCICTPIRWYGRCVYFGAQQNWAAYRQEVFAKQLADEAQMTAMMNQEAWEWGPWGWP